MRFPKKATTLASSSLFLLSFVVLVASCSALGLTDDDAGDQITVPTTEPTNTDPDTPDPDSTDPDSTDPDSTDGDNSDGDSTDTTDTTDGAPAGPDDERVLRWTVIAVEFDDTLNVRNAPEPSAGIVGTLAPWSTDLDLSGEVVDGPDGLWRELTLRDGVTGWVNGRFLVAQPVDFDPGVDGATMVEATSELIRWSGAGDGEAASPRTWLADRALWVGGTGIYGDGHNGWEWIDGAMLATRSAWEIPRAFTPPFGATTCGSDCTLTLDDYLKLGRLDDRHEILVDDLGGSENGGFIDGQLFLAPDDLHRTVIAQPPTTFIADDGSEQPNLDWQRIHVVFDWSGGDPAIALVHTWGWTP